MPSDERWVPRTHADCNLAQMQSAFAGADGIRWLPLVPEAPSGEADAAYANAALAAHAGPFDVAMLGMGADGHFASIFPGAPTLALALGQDTPAPEAVAILPDPMPAAGPHPRVSLSLPRLLHSRLLLLVITGGDKRAVLERAQAEGDWRKLPVAALLACEHPRFEVHWSP
ncbi:MAG: hypothetical protein OMOMHJEC_00311 [Xanthomonadales bacterium]|nr:hypothetical protein [Xanthomonadales bacterium]